MFFTTSGGRDKHKADGQRQGHRDTQIFTETQASRRADEQTSTRAYKQTSRHTHS